MHYYYIKYARYKNGPSKNHFYGKNDLGITETLLVPKFICLTLFVAHIYDNAPAKHD